SRMAEQVCSRNPSPSAVTPPAEISRNQINGLHQIPSWIALRPCYPDTQSAGSNRRFRVLCLISPKWVRFASQLHPRKPLKSNVLPLPSCPKMASFGIFLLRADLRVSASLRQRTCCNRNSQESLLRALPVPKPDIAHPPYRILVLQRQMFTENPEWQEPCPF